MLKTYYHLKSAFQRLNFVSNYQKSRFLSYDPQKSLNGLFPTKKLNFDAEAFNNYFSQRGPVFPVNSTKIKFLLDPKVFYKDFCERIDKAHNRIYLSSLYLGSEPDSIEIVKKIGLRLKDNPNLHVVVLLDSLRGTRNVYTPDSPAIKDSAFNNVVSSASLFAKLEQKYEHRIKVRYYQTPKLNGIWKKIIPEKYNELIGVQHIKCYLVDDDVMISGANLSHQYFDNRQDRYVWVNNSPHLAQFYINLIESICSISYRIRMDSHELEFPQNLPSPVNDPQSFIKLARNLLNNVYFSTKTNHFEENSDTIIFPTIQLGPVGIRYDENLCNFLLQHTPIEGYQTFITSPYFNLYNKYNISLLKSNKPINILVAAPSANGFYNGGKLLGQIPWAYDMLLDKFIRKLNPEQKKLIEIYEYIRQGWTYHGKGLWIVSNDSSYALTLVGSSNFGYRSIERDLESQIAIFTTNPHLIKQFEQEKNHLFGQSKLVSSQTFTGRKQHYSWFLPLILPIAINYM